MGSKTTCAPACLARLAVLSVELLSTTIISDVKQGLEFATSDAEMDCRQRAIRRSSLNAGMTIERCMEHGMLVLTGETATTLENMIVREKDMYDMHRNVPHRYVRIHGLYRGNVGIGTVHSP